MCHQIERAALGLGGSVDGLAKDVANVMSMFPPIPVGLGEKVRNIPWKMAEHQQPPYPGQNPNEGLADGSSSLPDILLSPPASHQMARHSVSSPGAGPSGSHNMGA
eukprot:scaffold229552_cov19-Prasinocladus_malaysianus.AAC.1